MPRTAWILVTIGLALVFGWLGWALWTENPLEDLALASPIARFMLLTGVAVTAVLGAALMMIAFRSSKRGFDDRANHYSDDVPPPG